MAAIPAVPDLYERDLRSALDARTASLRHLRELGPPDFVHLVKQSSKSSSKPQYGVFHHVTGIDASSSASLAAYIYTIQQSSTDRLDSLVSGTYCCYNSFSRLDMRVQVTIPGSVESYCIDERGEKRVATDDLWLETYLCGVIRAYHYADDGSGESVKLVIGMRRFNPITNESAEERFLQAAEKLFFNGWQLGSDLETQLPNAVSNHLTKTLISYFNSTGRYTAGIKLFERLSSREPEVSSLLARLYFLNNQEVKGVQVLHDSIKACPMDYALLDCQANFCNMKGRPDMAVEVAKRAVIASPSEFIPWARLADIYVNSEQWDLALLTLNACPMFNSHETDLPRFPEPKRVVQPILPQSICPEVQDEIPEGEKVADSLARLNAATLRGTLLKAYLILTKITRQIGWDPLLQIRSQIFVMEEEYRMEKQQTGKPATASVHEADDGSDESESGNSLAHSPTSPAAETNGESALNIKPDNGEPTSPASAKLDKSVGAPTKDDSEAHDQDPSELLYGHKLRNKRLCERWLDNLFMILYEDLQVYSNWRTEVGPLRSPQSNHHLLVQNSRSSLSWECLGNLATRLHQYDDAIEAYQSCLATRFSPRAMKGILDILQRQHIVTHNQTHPNPRLASQFNIYRHEVHSLKDNIALTAAMAASGPKAHPGGNSISVLQGSPGTVTNTSMVTINALVRLIAWQYRWYSEFSPELLQAVRLLIEEEGDVKVNSLIQSTNFPESVRSLALGYARLCSTFRDPQDSREM